MGGQGPLWIENRKLENQKKELKSLMIIYFRALYTVKCLKTALYSSPATTCTKFSVHVGEWFPKKKLNRRWVGVVSSIQFFLDVWDCFNFARPLIVLFAFVLYCILYVLWMYIYMKSETNKVKKNKNVQVPKHKVLTRTEWILASTGDACPTFTRYWVDVGL